jgi:hypothetical protein
MRSDSFWAKIMRVSRAGPPLFKITASPWLLDVLVAAGAQRARVDDSMTVKFGQRGYGPAVRRRVKDSRVGSSRARVMRPRTYNEARGIGERFRNGEPVIMDLRGMTDRDARRLVDFAAGLIFGLRGSIDKIESKVFILLPAGMQVSTRVDNAASGYGIIVVSPDLGERPVPKTDSERPVPDDEGIADDIGDLFDLLHVVS